MKRYAAFDPPEYQDWASDPDLVFEFRARVLRDPDLAQIVDALSENRLLELYRDLLRTRLFDITLKRWVRQGVLSKAWLCTGEEAATVGAVAALDRQRDVVIPMIRNAGALHMMRMPLADMFRGYLATPDSPNGGRDLHIGDLSKRVIQPISHMGTNVPVIAGVALAFKNKGEDRVALTWIGDGATRTAECHEGANFAAVRGLPAVFIIQNNQVALGTTLDQHTAGDLADWGSMYGIPTHVCDGNNVLELYATTRLAVERCRRGEGPAAILANTFRMGGHATHDEREARETFPAELFVEWGRRDPIGLYEEYLRAREVTPELLETVESAVLQEMETAAEEALSSRDLTTDPERAVYEPFSEGGTLAALAKRPV
jgi:TPP-dependent pyruvate/acetoin dehydrogenase alpha subunit